MNAPENRRERAAPPIPAELEKALKASRVDLTQFMANQSENRETGGAALELKFPNRMAVSIAYSPDEGKNGMPRLNIYGENGPFLEEFELHDMSLLPDILDEVFQLAPDANGGFNKSVNYENWRDIFSTPQFNSSRYLDNFSYNARTGVLSYEFNFPNHVSLYIDYHAGLFSLARWRLRIYKNGLPHDDDVYGSEFDIYKLCQVIELINDINSPEY